MPSTLSLRKFVRYHGEWLPIEGRDDSKIPLEYSKSLKIITEPCLAVESLVWKLNMLTNCHCCVGAGDLNNYLYLDSSLLASKFEMTRPGTDLGR